MKSKIPKNGVNFWMFKGPLEPEKNLDKIRLARIKKDKDMEDLSNRGFSPK